MPQTTVYHYTSIPRAGNILGKWIQPRAKPGLDPEVGIGIWIPGEEPIYGSFALLEPTPHNWTNNPLFPGVWGFLLEKIRSSDYPPVLLEVSLDLEKNNVRVAERAHMEGWVRGNMYPDLPLAYRHTDEIEARTAFMNSMISLKEYLQRQAQGEVVHSLPEVIIFDHIPPERIRVSDQQLLLEQDLGWHWGREREELAAHIAKGHIHRELLPWRQQYEAKNGPLEIIYRKKEAL